MREPHWDNGSDALVYFRKAHRHFGDAPTGYSATNIDAYMIRIYSVRNRHREADNDVHSFMGVRHDTNRNIRRHFIVEYGVNR